MARSFASLFAARTFDEAMARLRLDPAKALLEGRVKVDQDAKPAKSRFLAKERLGDAAQPDPQIIRNTAAISRNRDL
jgi:hypothetical protein